MAEVEGRTDPPGRDDLDAPRLSLDGLLRQLVSRAEDVIAGQGRLRALLAATDSLLSAADFAVVLRRVVEAACSLVSARYCALGVLTPSEDSIDQLITSGTPEPRPLAVPPGPSGGDELNIPVRVRDRLFGYLYLRESEAGAFTTDDEELATALAATAGVVIDNARLFEQARRRQTWLEASALVTRQLLSAGGEDPLALIAREARALGHADVSAVVRPAPDGERLVVEVASGRQEDHLIGLSFDAETSLSGRALAEDHAVLVLDASSTVPMSGAIAAVNPMGPAMAIPLRGTSALLGTLFLARSRGRRPFDDNDLEMASAFANHAAVALELADARADQQRMAVLEDRDRIAQTLHDQVIQRLFAAGLSVQGIAGSTPEYEDVEGHQERLRRVVGDIDDTIRQIRTSVFELGSSSAGSVRSRLLAVAADAGGVLTAPPTVVVDESVELLAGSEDLVSDVVAVLREGLTNVARHASATGVKVETRIVDRSLYVEITDDGVGMGGTDRRSGLANLRSRAEARGGGLMIEPASATRDRPGTRLVWSVRLG